MIIQPSDLSADALRGIADQHVLTFCNPDEAEMQFSRWVEQTINQIRTGELLIEFSEHHESIRLINKEEMTDADSPSD